MENTKQEERIKELESILKEINEAGLLPEYYKNRIERALRTSTNTTKHRI